MTAARTAKLANDPETSTSSALTEIENALNSSLSGATPTEKGYGVQHVRDADGKLVDVIVFFDEKVPQSEKSAALSKIANNNGVATVQPAESTGVLNFDDHANGFSLWSPSGGYVGPVDWRVDQNGGLNGGVLLPVVTNARAVSLPHSLSATVTNASGNIQGVGMRVWRDTGLPAGVPIQSFDVSMNISTPADFHDTNARFATMRFLRRFVVRYTSSTGTALGDASLFWATVGDNGSPPTAWSTHFGPDGGTLAAGALSDLDIPADGNFYKLRIWMDAGIDKSLLNCSLGSNVVTFRMPTNDAAAEWKLVSSIGRIELLQANWEADDGTSNGFNVDDVSVSMTLK